ncbi:3-keto-5-aminohexanoate cleavage protein, partial [Sinorhizobium meliloti]|nr:3-keto-5-aminohexanoate cleavage protein [Sinorhizobium meliloti]MDX0029589.1 3-keto-5-aminohexanoate cleavage protein [Sinorhizobium meliloti]MDX0073650.1 3-keto-5-aminohexanoate cleavage protein [Sinorhizobium meliloti]
MIVQACLNGARPGDYHPRLPLTADAIALDGAACVSAGA